MTDTQVTKVILEVAELGTPATNVSQVVLEVAYTPSTPPTPTLYVTVSNRW
jgi:hypothetical protein